MVPSFIIIAVLSLYGIGILVDVVTTWIGISILGGTEVNSLFKHIYKFANYNINYFVLLLFTIKSLSIIPLYYFLTSSNKTLVIITLLASILYLRIPISNTLQIVSAFSTQTQNTSDSSNIH